MDQSREKVAIFDFCDTLVAFQTADAFVMYVYKKKHSLIMRFLHILHLILVKMRVIHILSRMFPNASINKRITAFYLIGMKETDIIRYAKDYYEQMIKPSFILDTIQALKDYQHKGFRIVISSGGYEPYLRCFIEDFGIDPLDLICTKFHFFSGRFLGFFRGKDCMKQQKVIELNKRFSKELIYSIAYSDSMSDIPMLAWANKSYVVKKYCINNTNRANIYEKEF